MESGSESEESLLLSWRYGMGAAEELLLCFDINVAKKTF